MMKTFVLVIFVVAVMLPASSALAGKKDAGSVTVPAEELKKVEKRSFEASRDGFAGAVKSGIALRRAEDMVNNGGPGKYPAKLDSAKKGKCSAKNLCFTNVLKNVDPETFERSCWSKDEDLKYRFKCGEVETTYVYDPKKGEFKAE